MRFLLFGPSMPAYMPAEPTTLSDVSRSEIRDGVEMGGGGEDRGEERREGTIATNEEKSEMLIEEIVVVKGR